MGKNNLFVKLLIVFAFMFTYCGVVEAAEIEVDTPIQMRDQIVNATEDTNIKLSDDFDAVINTQMTFTASHGYTVTIEGNNKTFTSSDTNKQHFLDITLSNATNINFRDMNFKGNLVLDQNGKPSIPNNLMSTWGAITITATKTSTVKFDNIKFEKLCNSAILMLTPANVDGVANVYLDNIVAKQNAGKVSSVLNIFVNDSDNDIKVTNSHFEDNYNSVIYGRSHIGKIDISNSVFKNNKGVAAYDKKFASGAISISFPNHSNDLAENKYAVNITDCLFEGNESEDSGGAVGLYSKNAITDININNSNFVNNRSLQSGGALAVYNMIAKVSGYSSDISVENSTFTKNGVYTDNYYSPHTGGAMNFETKYVNNINDPARALRADKKISLNLIGNTVIDNEVKSQLEAYGAGINIQDASALAEGSGLSQNIVGNILLNNKIYINDEHTASNKSNINISFTDSTSPFYLALGKQIMTLASENIGFDNGESIADNFTLNNIYGTNSPQLLANDSKMIGSSTNLFALKTFIHIPKTATKGFADNSAISMANVLLKDQREQRRSTSTPDYGSVEIGFVKYDANGGSWSLPTLTNYDGTVYYEGTSPTTYYNVGSLDQTSSIINNDNLSNNNKEFLGWSTNKNDNAPQVAINDSILLSEEATYYAIWKKDTTNPVTKVTVTFNKNATDAKDGSIIKQNVVKSHSLKQDNKKLGNPTRKGYTLIGWCTSQSSCTKQMDFDSNTPINKNITVYAQWKNDSNSIIDRPSDLPDTGVNDIYYAVLFIASLSVLYSLKRKIQS